MYDKIIHLRCSDISEQGNLKNPFFKDKIVVVMIHSNMCGYCRIAYPEYEKLPKLLNNNNVIFLAIQLDGNVKGEQECGILLNKILPNFNGIPEYGIFLYGNVLKRLKVNNRSANGIINALKQYF